MTSPVPDQSGAPREVEVLDFHFIFKQKQAPAGRVLCKRKKFNQTNSNYKSPKQQAKTLLGYGRMTVLGSRRFQTFDAKTRIERLSPNWLSSRTPL